MEPTDEAVKAPSRPGHSPMKSRSFEGPKRTPIPETSVSTLTRIVTNVVEIEGPIHKEEIARRMTSLWGQQRTGNRIIGAMTNAIELAIRKGNLQSDGEFVSHSERTEIPVRSRSEVTAANLNKPEMLPPAEIAAAIRKLLTEHIGLHRQEIVAMVARLLGFKTTPAKLKEAIDAVVIKLIEQGQASIRDGQTVSTSEGLTHAGYATHNVCPADGGRADLPASRQPALLPVPGQADGPDHLHRALRRGPERRLRRDPLSRRAARAGIQPDPDVLRHLSRGPRLVQDREEHAGADRRQVHRPLAPDGHPRRGRRRNRFDLGRWNDAYFERLKAFVAAASERGIVVEYVLFCPFYEEDLWAVNPMNARNNVNGVGNIPRNEAYTGKHRDLQEKQEAFVRKAVRELNGFDNLYFEICNEPYFGGVTLEWQARIAAVIVETEKDLPHKHLLAQNIANEKARIERPNPAVSIFNFHYATPPATVGMNYGLGKVIGDDETGFRGVARPALPDRGLGFPHRRRRDLRPPRLLVHDRPRGRHGPDRRPHARRRRAGVPCPVAGPEAVHRGIRLREDGPGRQGHRPRRPRIDLGPALCRTGQGLCDLRPRRDQGHAGAGTPRRPLPGRVAEPAHGKVEKTGEIESRGGRVDVASPPYEEDIALGIRRVGTP